MYAHKERFILEHKGFIMIQYDAIRKF